MAFYTIAQLAGVIVGTTLLLYLGRAVYRVYFHPLSKFPGPKYAAFSDIWFAHAWLCGRWPQIMVDVHKKYGDVVRIAPTELSFASVEAYRTVLGHASKDGRPFLKDDFYDMNEAYPNIVTARDPPVHRMQRQMLSSAFSAKSLRAQENLVVHKYADQLMRQLTKLGGPGTSGIDMEEALAWVTFDVIGDLSFGEPFGATENGKTHPWMAIMLNGQIVLSLASLQRRLPMLNLALPWILPKNAMANFEFHKEMTQEKARKRMEMGSNGKEGDFFSVMLGKRGNTITQAEIESQAATLVSAGSETTSTALTGMLVFLLTHPESLAKLCHEVRSSYASYGDINGDAAAQLPYLNGVIQEGLRLFPPGPAGLPRISPGGTIAGHYVPPGYSVRVSLCNTQVDPRYWRDADQFRPERWCEEGYDDVKEAWGPFSRGPRVCIGINLAMLEMRVILSKMMWLYDMEWVNRMDNYWDLCKLRFLWYKPPLMIRYHPRAGLPEGSEI